MTESDDTNRSALIAAYASFWWAQESGETERWEELDAAEREAVIENSYAEHVADWLGHPDTARALLDVAQERGRQVEKGWTREHDDEHQTHTLVKLAGQRAQRSGSRGQGFYARESLVEAAAMLVAAIEAMDRSEAGR